MRRFSRMLAALCLLLAASFAVPLGAAAAPGPRAQTGPCPGASAYPPVTNAMLGVSTTSPAVGETIEVSGQSYCANEDVKIYLNGVFRATAHTDSTGAFDPPLVVHGPVGDQTLSGIGASGLTNDRDSLVLHVHAARSAHVAESIGGGGGLSSTGTDIALIVAIAIVLLAGGTAVAYVGRRRRAS
jgi:hypothetical protein